MIKRFEGPDGIRLLGEALRQQHFVEGNEALIQELLAHVTLTELKSGETLITEGAHDNDLYLIIAGEIDIFVHGSWVQRRTAGRHVGELALIDPSEPRSASAVSVGTSLVAKVTEPKFAQLADQWPRMWRCIAKDAASRLRDRNQLVEPANLRPVIFIGSSVEGLSVAKQIQLGLSHSYTVPQIWTNNVFVPGQGSMENLEERIKTADFGVLVCTPDDRSINEKRNIDEYAPRDNVILELGMCLGRLGRQRTIFVKPRRAATVPDLKMPTDLLGITPIDYVGDDPTNLAAHISSVCTQIENVVLRLRARGKSKEGP